MLFKQIFINGNQKNCLCKDDYWVVKATAQSVIELPMYFYPSERSIINVDLNLHLTNNWHFYNLYHYIERPKTFRENDFEGAFLSLLWQTVVWSGNYFYNEK